MPRSASTRNWALRSRDFRLYMLGNLISWVGDWMDLAALNWAVLALGGSPVQLALMNACRLIPVFALSLPAGVLADRHDRRRLLIALQAGTMVMTFLVGGLLATRSPFSLLVLAVTVRASLSAMVLPIRNALLPDLVPQDATASAVATQAAVMNLSRIVGPAIAGGLLLVVPVGTVFWINGASFAAVLWTLAVVRSGAAPSSGQRSDARVGVGEAIAYICGDGAVRSLLTLAVVPMIFGFPYTSLMPLFVRDLLHLGPAGYGALMSVAAAGALTGSALLSIPRRWTRPGRTLIISTIALGLSLLAFTAARGVAVAACSLFLVGFTSQVYRTTSRITLQHHVPDHLRGRILSIALMDRGLIPLGGLLMGAVAEFGGTVCAGLLMGGGCALVTLAVAASQRRIWWL